MSDRRPDRPLEARRIQTGPWCPPQPQDIQKIGVAADLSERIVAQVVAELHDFLVDNPAKSWPAALERSERRVFEILKETRSNSQ